MSFLRDRGPAVRAHLFTDIVPFAQAQRAYDALEDGALNGVQVVLEPAGAASPPAPSSQRTATLENARRWRGAFAPHRT